jgi:hypothetical protein
MLLERLADGRPERSLIYSGLRGVLKAFSVGIPGGLSAAASLFLSLAGAAEQPDDFVTDVDDAVEANLRGVSR